MCLMKVYIVTYDNYDHNTIEGVFSTKAKAESYIKDKYPNFIEFEEDGDGEKSVWGHKDNKDNSPYSVFSGWFEIKTASLV